MKKFLTVSVSVLAGFLLALLVLSPRPAAHGGVDVQCSAKNGDVNADGTVDLSDAITVIGNLFLGTPPTLLPLCAPVEGPGRLPATGQETCFEFNVEGLWVEVPCGEATCSGQDGFYGAGCSKNFVDNGDGTVTDNCTGLMWQKETADVPEPDDRILWCDAMDYCENLTLAGHTDWRLPNVKELQSIVDYGRKYPAIDPIFEAKPNIYWSSSTNLETGDDAWGVYFHIGGVGVVKKIGEPEFSYNFVRAVRNAR